MSSGSGYYPQQPYFAPGWDAQPPPPRRGRWQRPVLLALLALLAIGLIVGGALAALTFRDSRTIGDVDRPTSATARQLDVGHCIARLPEDGDVGRVPLVPCSDPHEAEVVGVLSLPDGAGPADDDTLADRAVAWCEMDTAQQEAGFRPVVWTPSERSWAQGDRQALCLAWTGGGTSTGSFTAGDEVSAPDA